MNREPMEQAQDESRQAADSLAALIDFMPIGFFELDGQAVIRQVNPAGAALLGLERSRVIGQTFEQFVVPTAWSEFNAFCQGVPPDDSRRACEVRLLKHDRSPCDVLVNAAATTGGSGERQGWRLAVIDITDRKRDEEKLRRHTATLDQLTAQLAARSRELDRYNRAMVGRELRMMELKQEINDLCAQARQPPRYPGGSDLPPQEGSQ